MKPGDRVRLTDEHLRITSRSRDDSTSGILLAVHENWLWVETPKGLYPATWSLSVTEPAPEPEPPVIGDRVRVKRSKLPAYFDVDGTLVAIVGSWAIIDRGGNKTPECRPFNVIERR